MTTAPQDAGSGIGIKSVTQKDADDGSNGAAGYQADHSTDRFSDPLHTLIY